MDSEVLPQDFFEVGRGSARGGGAAAEHFAADTVCSHQDRCEGPTLECQRDELFDQGTSYPPVRGQECMEVGVGIQGGGGLIMASSVAMVCALVGVVVSTPRIRSHPFIAALFEKCFAASQQLNFSNGVSHGAVIASGLNRLASFTRCEIEVKIPKIV